MNSDGAESDLVPELPLLVGEGAHSEPGSSYVGHA
jgi:hypothetical protein